MFSLKQPTAAAIENRIAAASRLGYQEPHFLKVTGNVDSGKLPSGFVRDRSETVLGSGAETFKRAKAALRAWRMFDLGWVRVANAGAAIAQGQIVGVEVHALGLWSLNLSRIVDVMDAATMFGFVYATTPLHAEEGEERFLLRLDEATGEVRYALEAVSRPRTSLARLGYPVTRSFQHRFARDSHWRMKSALSPHL